LTVNEFFRLQNIHDSAIENEEENIALKIFTVHQKILYKKLITITCVKNHLEKVHKLELLKIQKLILKEMMNFFLILTRFNTHYKSMQDFIYCNKRCASTTLFSHQKSLLSALYIITVLNARIL